MSFNIIYTASGIEDILSFPRVSTKLAFRLILELRSIKKSPAEGRGNLMFSQRNNPYCDLLHFTGTKLLQKSEMRKDIVIELSYKGFS